VDYGKQKSKEKTQKKRVETLSRVLKKSLGLWVRKMGRVPLGHGNVRSVSLNRGIKQTRVNSLPCYFAQLPNLFIQFSFLNCSLIIIPVLRVKWDQLCNA
jgi:hypothetical protein